MTNATSQRLYFLDWIRIFAFLLLIFYHTGMYYVTWDWHVKSPHASDALEPLMMLSAPWRLGLLFLISGVASAFMLQKISVAAFLRQRSARLLIPLLFGMLVIVPPQSYCEVIEKLGYQGSLPDFMRLYLSGYHGFCKDHSCLILPTWNHLWFVAYLWTYTLVLGALVLTLGQRIDALAARVAQLLAGWKLIAVPFAVLAVARIELAPRFPTTHTLIDDWSSHAYYFSIFVLGALMAAQPVFWQRAGQQRWASIAIALTCWAVLMIVFAMPEQMLPPLPLRMAVFALCQWSAILAAVGFGQRHLQFDSAGRRYLTQAVFPVYILHQTLIVCMAHALKPAQLAPAVEGPVLIILTLAISFGVFEVVRRVPLLRPLFGIGKVAGDGMRPAAAGTLADAV